MSDFPRDDPLRDIWKENDMQATAPNAAGLAARQESIEACADRRNRIEYVAGGIVFVLLAATGIVLLSTAGSTGTLVSGVGNLLVAVAVAWVMARLARRQRAARAVVPGTPILTHLRHRLTAERDMLRGAWAWYVAPLVPGFVLVYAGMALEPRPNWWVFGLGSAGTAAVIAWVAWLNHRAALRMEREIARLDDD